MQGQSEGSQLETIERSKVYTATGDAIVRENYKDPLIGQVLEKKYRILQVIGWGGMSVVYKARHELVDRLVAIKTVKFRPDERPDVWQRFQREIITLSRLSHPNVVTVYDCVVGNDGQPYVVMDHISGCTLDDILRTAGRLQLRRLCSIGSQVAAAVEHAHRHNVIHRDLKPANIMILGEDEKFEVKVVDFGLAKLGEDDQRLTQTGQLWGSPPYISPEQIKGGEVDHRCDIYSLGIVLYEMACGRDPFASDVVYEMLHHHLHHEPPPFAEVCPSNPPPRELEAVVRRALAKKPEDRYQSMAALKEDLERACLSAEKRMAAEAAKNPQSAARATTGRLSAMGRSTIPLKNRTPSCSNSKFSRANFIYVALSTLLILAAAVLVSNRALYTGPVQGQAQAHASSAVTTAAPVPAPASQTTGAFSAVVGPDREPISKEDQPQHAENPLKIKAATPPSLAKASAAHSKIRMTSPKARTFITKRENSLPVKKSLPNASKLPVDQSKFEILRDLKSPVLRQECGDVPQK